MVLRSGRPRQARYRAATQFYQSVLGPVAGLCRGVDSHASVLMPFLESCNGGVFCVAEAEVQRGCRSRGLLDRSDHEGSGADSCGWR